MEERPMSARKRMLLLSLTTAVVISAPRVVMAQQPAETAIPDKVKLFIPFKDYTAEDNKRILDMYSWLRVADVSDGMDVVGLASSIPRCTRCGRTRRSSRTARSGSP
jgi:hypothetical protein